MDSICYIMEDETYPIVIERTFQTIEECRNFLNMFHGWFEWYQDTIQHAYGKRVTLDNMPLGAWRMVALMKWIAIGHKKMWFPEAWGNPWSVRMLVDDAIYNKVAVYTACPQVVNFYPVSNVKIIRNGQLHLPVSGYEEWEKKFTAGQLWTMGNLTRGLDCED